MSNFLCEFIFVWISLLLWTSYAFYTFVHAFLPEYIADITCEKIIFTYGLSTHLTLYLLNAKVWVFFTQINFLIAFLCHIYNMKDGIVCQTSIFTFVCILQYKAATAWYLYKHYSKHWGFYLGFSKLASFPCYLIFPCYS